MDASNKDLMSIHLEYHPDEVPRKKIRDLFEKHCGERFEKSLGIKRTIVAYSTAKNLRDHLDSAKLREQSGCEVSTFFGG